MLKISISASRALLGLGVITALAANATEVTPDNFQQNFEEKDGVWINKNQSGDFESVESVQDLADEFEKKGKIDFDKYKEDLLVLYTLKVNGDKLGAEGRLQVNARTLLYAKLQMIKSMKDNLEETKE
ncbi:hypothetical protein [uncultured Helicobacter sp.]|uniref:hypothetical protein n=1 Tax=uncultured Helicobacter sp. TaxID=175537 RepID=UPI0026128B16|nr:hypothetical protein [uncultured Helicobacter sp.]